jgi:hypothetical protein
MKCFIAVISILFIISAASADCSLDFVSEFEVVEAYIGYDMGTVAVQARTRTISCSGNDCVVYHEYRCPTDNKWYVLNQLTSDISSTEDTYLQSDTNIVLSATIYVFEPIPSKFTEFPCGSGFWTIDQIALRDRNTNLVQNHTARSTVRCYSYCSIVYEYECDMNDWGRYGSYSSSLSYNL